MLNEKSVSRNLRCILTDNEVRLYGVTLARENSLKEEAEERKKEVDAQLKAEIESHSLQAQSLARKINNGYEYRDVLCLPSFNFENNSFTLIRQDTLEVIEDRAMTEEERQLGLNL